MSQEHSGLLFDSSAFCAFWLSCIVSSWMGLSASIKLTRFSPPIWRFVAQSDWLSFPGAHRIFISPWTPRECTVGSEPWGLGWAKAEVRVQSFCCVYHGWSRTQDCILFCDYGSWWCTAQVMYFEVYLDVHLQPPLFSIPIISLFVFVFFSWQRVTREQSVKKGGASGPQATGAWSGEEAGFRLGPVASSLFSIVSAISFCFSLSGFILSI